MNRFINRIWKLTAKLEITDKENPETLKILHKTIKGVTEDVERISYNTAIAS